jgi:cytochrome c oxidase subunit 2
MYDSPSAYVENVDSVMIYIVTISAILLLGITFAMVYFVFKYNRKKGHKPVDIHGNVLLETIWIVIPALIALSMFFYGYLGYKDLVVIPNDAYFINVVGKMWEWEFSYDNGKKSKNLYVPLRRTIALNLESEDVNHSLYIPAFRIKSDVIAGKINQLVFTPEKPGEYIIACAEYCGLNHSDMYSKLIVLPEGEFNLWLSENDNNSIKSNNNKN